MTERPVVLIVAPDDSRYNRQLASTWRTAVPSEYDVVVVPSPLTGRQMFDEHRDRLTMIVVNDMLSAGHPADRLLMYFCEAGYDQYLVLADSAAGNSLVAQGRNTKCSPSLVPGVIADLLSS